MNTPIHESDLAAATGTLALLNRQADAVRAELVKLRLEMAEVERGFSGERAAQLAEANEHLVLASLRADAIAEAAVSNLRELMRSGLAVPNLGNLREANEQLVLAAIAAQELEADAGAAHRRQITFLAMVAHELRNPLTPILQAAELLHRPLTDDPRLARLQGVIKRQVTHMARLIDDLLDGSRISTGKFRLERGSVDLANIIGVAVETCQPAMDARLQRFTMQSPPGPLDVYGDSVRLTQIFSNLLDNASKYTPTGGTIALDVKVIDDTIAITVSDNGIGITAAALPRVFDLFAQDPHALALHSGGLGIGLAVVSELVEAHGGTVVGDSAGKDLGSEFVVTLPMAGSPAATAAD